ncbi:MAG: SAM-dependent methyltransferase [Steroidobacteraceae bacterium]|jgi:SAM-dependent MidA family methyltransferase
MRHEPLLSPDQVRHTTRVHEFIAAAIAEAGGWISFERFMELALYAPGLGYYSAGALKLGRDGDFTTAPEISSLFGACIAQQCAQIFGDVTGGSILEVGAGSGRLAVDTLARLESLRSLPARYFILETSADLRERQHALVRECIPHLAPRVAWLDAPPDAPFDGVILANEVVDALPVARFRWHESACEELGVAVSDGAFAWSAQPAGPAMTDACSRLAQAAGGWDDGYVSEYCPRLGAWTQSIGRCLRRGAVLWFDYGLPRPQYYLPERHEGTLICHRRQRAHDNPFEHPGLEDISAWVDFTSLAEACGGAGCELAGFTTQAYFLAGLGIDREMHELAGGNDGRFARLANQAKELMLPGGMGERFKAMAWARGLRRELSGFALQDLRHTL